MPNPNLLRVKLSILLWLKRRLLEQLLLCTFRSVWLRRHWSSLLLIELGGLVVLCWMLLVPTLLGLRLLLCVVVSDVLRCTWSDFLLLKRLLLSLLIVEVFVLLIRVDV